MSSTYTYSGAMQALKELYDNGGAWHDVVGMEQEFISRINSLTDIEKMLIGISEQEYTPVGRVLNTYEFPEHFLVSLKEWASTQVQTKKHNPLGDLVWKKNPFLSMIPEEPGFTGKFLPTTVINDKAK